MNGELLLKIARQAIASAFGLAPEVDREALVAQYPELEKEQATFVTLTIGGQLRGCIGSIIPHRPLIDDLVANARAAAFDDPRFPKLTPEEFERVDIEVSLLTVPRELPYRDVEDLRSKIRPGVDGVILKDGFRRATFLPQVWEKIPSPEQFLSELCLKMGAPADLWRRKPLEVATYQVEEFHE